MEAVREDLAGVIEQEADRFPSAPRLLRRFDDTVSRLLERGWAYLPSVKEAHNELCTAVLVLEDDAEPRCTHLAYEPALPDCEKRFDFRADFAEQPPLWLEVKSIHPEPLDRWDEYVRDTEEERFPANAGLILEQSWMGGELYHKYFSARAKVLQYTIETEAKIAECCLEPPAKVLLVLFSDGFDWHVDTLEDFLHFYRFGEHFDGDHFRQMELHHIGRNSIQLSRRVDHFSFFKRPAGAIRPVGGTWNVRPVRFSPDRGYF